MAPVSIYPQRINGHRTVRPWKPGAIALPKKRCLVCREWFRPERAFQKFCTKVCRRKPKPQAIPPRLCRICKAKFKPTRKWNRYCSSSCRDRYHLHPKRRPFESMEDCLRRARIYQSGLSRLWRASSVRNGTCRSCPKKLMRNSKSWCRKHWFMQVVNRYGFQMAEWRIAEAILKRQSYVCPYSGVRLVPGINASLDHRMPKAKYPHLRNDWSNVQWVDWYINNIKQTLSTSEFSRRLKLVVNKKAPRLATEGF